MKELNDENIEQNLCKTLFYNRISRDDAAAAVDDSPVAGENELERRRLRRRPGFDRGVVGLSRDKDSALTPRAVVLSSSKSE